MIMNRVELIGRWSYTLSQRKIFTIRYLHAVSASNIYGILISLGIPSPAIHSCHTHIFLITVHPFFQTCIHCTIGTFSQASQGMTSSALSFIHPFSNTTIFHSFNMHKPSKNIFNSTFLHLFSTYFITPSAGTPHPH